MSTRLGLLAVPALLLAVPAYAVPVIGVIGDNLVQFDSATPGTITTTLAVTGLGTDVIRGLDTRPSNGVLYAFAQPNFATNASLYTINTATGAATRVGSVGTNSGVDFGFAFNPTVDRIRLVNADNSNFRIDPNTGATTTDTPLSFAPGDRNFGVDPTVTGAAYTNQFAGATMTTLYDIDVMTSSLVVQTNPNGGVLSTVGSLGVTLFGNGAAGSPGVGVGFDIDAASGVAFASFINSVGSTGFYTVNLLTGAATFVGAFGPDGPRDIAIGTLGGTGSNPGGVNVPEPASMALLGLGLAGLSVARRRRG